MVGKRERRRRSERKCETRKAERGGGTSKQAAEPTGIARRLKRGEERTEQQTNNKKCIVKIKNNDDANGMDDGR